MVFASLGPREKDAFFGLLDEYFASRPEIFAAGGEQRSGTPQNAQQDVASTVASSMKRAMVNNPEATAKVFSAGLRQAASSPSAPPKRSAFSAASSPAPASNANADEDEPVQTSIANRIAAFSAGRSSPASATPNTTSSTRSFGDVNLSSTKGFVNSLRHPGQQPAAPTPPPPAPSFKSNSFSAPAPRRFGANANTESNGPPPPAPPPPPPPPPPMRAAAQQEEEEEERGDWAEALYEYASAEEGDLNIKEGQRVLVTERSSDDWWTGEIDGNGKSGLFPASYVKLL